MADNAVSLRMDSFGRCAAALTLVVLLHLGVWLLFAAGAGIATYLIRRFWLHTYRWRPLQVAAAAVALVRPPEDRHSIALVGVLAGARPRRVAVDRASRILHDQGNELDWGAAMREIVLADELTTALAADPEHDWVPVRLAVWASVTVLGTMFALPVGVFVAGFVGTLIAVIDFQEQRHVQPTLLAVQALRSTPSVSSSPPTASRLALLAESSPVIDRAITRVVQAEVPESERGDATLLLEQARGLARPGRSTSKAVNGQ